MANRDLSRTRTFHQLSGEVRIQHIRRMLGKILESKEKEKVKTLQLEKYLKHLSVCLSIILTVQFTLNVAQTTVFANVNKNVLGVFSLLASVSSFSLACLGRHTFNQRKELEKCAEAQRRWDKVEDTFTMELANSLADGELTSQEHQKLKDIYKDASDFVDGCHVVHEKISPL